jgi:hypothetical protein
MEDETKTIETPTPEPVNVAPDVPAILAENQNPGPSAFVQNEGHAVAPDTTPGAPVEQAYVAPVEVAIAPPLPDDASLAARMAVEHVTQVHIVENNLDPESAANLARASFHKSASAVGVEAMDGAVQLFRHFEHFCAQALKALEALGAKVIHSIERKL